MTAMLTEPAVASQADQFALDIPDTSDDQHGGYRDFAEKLASTHEDGWFTTYANGTTHISRPGFSELYYSMLHGSHYGTEQTGVPVYYKRRGKVVFGLLDIENLGRPEKAQPGVPVSCWVVAGTLTFEDGEQVSVRGRFSQNTSSGWLGESDRIHISETLR